MRENRIQAMNKRLNHWLPRSKSAQIIDLGCGNGEFLILLKRLGYTNYLGIDANRKIIQEAARCLPEGKVEVGEIIKFLSNNKKKFDLICAFDVVEHFSKENALKCLTLIHRSLKKDGLFLLQLPNPNSPLVNAVYFGDITHQNMYAPSSLRTILEQTGFVKIEMQEISPSVHSPVSFLRFIFWRIIRRFIWFHYLVETGSPADNIYSRVFLVKAKKINQV